MTRTKRSLGFYKLLHELEYTIGSECYNISIQNFGSGGVWEGEGREFRYPVTFINKDGGKEKYRGKLPFTESSTGDKAYCILGEERFQSAYYAFGANNLHILRALSLCLKKLEERFDINFDELIKEELGHSVGSIQNLLSGTVVSELYKITTNVRFWPRLFENTWALLKMGFVREIWSSFSTQPPHDLRESANIDRF